MKMIQMIAWGAVFACGMAQGNEAVRSDKAAPNAKALAMVEALVGFCAKVDPESAGKYDSIIQQMVQGQSNKVLAELRASDDYVQSHDAMLESMAKVDEQKAKQSCAESSAQFK